MIKDFWVAVGSSFVGFLASFGFGSFWLVLGRFGWFWVVSCFRTTRHKICKSITGKVKDE